MMSADELSTMPSLPAIGFGTRQNTESSTCTESVKVALEAGYRHIDTSKNYKNEEAVSEGIAEAGISREEIL